MAKKSNEELRRRYSRVASDKEESQAMSKDTGSITTSDRLRNRYAGLEQSNLYNSANRTPNIYDSRNLRFQNAYGLNRRRTQREQLANQTRFMDEQRRAVNNGIDNGNNPLGLKNLENPLDNMRRLEAYKEAYGKNNKLSYDESQKLEKAYGKYNRQQLEQLKEHFKNAPERDYSGEIAWVNEKLLKTATGKENKQRQNILESQIKDADNRLERLQEAYADRLVGGGTDNGDYLDKLNQIKQEKSQLQNELNDYKELTNYSDQDDFAKYKLLGEANPNNPVRFFRTHSDEQANAIFDPTIRNEVDTAHHESTYTGGGSNQSDRALYRAITDEEADNYSYILGKYGQEEADKYLQAVAKHTDVNGSLTALQEAQEQGYKNPLLRTAESIGLGLITPVEAAKNLISGDEVRTYDDYKLAGRQEALRSGAAEKLTGGNEIGTFLYNTATSAADNLLRYAVGGGIGAVTGDAGAAEGAMRLMMGGQVMDSAMKNALDRGLSDSQAVTTALISAVNEELFETISLSNLKAMQSVTPKNYRELAKNIGKQFLGEGSEEMFTDIGNAIADDLVNGEKSEIRQNILNYMKQGMSEEEAKKQASVDFALQLVESGLSGGITGAAMGGAVAVDQAKSIKANQKYKELFNTYKESGLSEEDAVNTALSEVMNGLQTVRDKEGNVKDYKGLNKSIDKAIASAKNINENIKNIEAEMNGVSPVSEEDIRDNKEDIRDNELNNEYLTDMQRILSHGDITTDAQAQQFLSDQDEMVAKYPDKKDEIIKATVDVYMKGKNNVEVFDGIASKVTNTMAKNETSLESKNTTFEGISQKEDKPAKVDFKANINGEEAVITSVNKNNMTVRDSVGNETTIPINAAEMTDGASAAVEQAKQYGKRGSRLYLENMAGNIRDYTYTFNDFYNAGKQGKDFYGRNTRGLNTDFLREVYDAGVQDGSKASKTGGLVRNDARYTIQESEARVLDAVGKAFNVTIQMDHMLSHDANGYLSDGVIHISTSAEKPSLVVFSHEFTHRLEDTSPEAYKAYKDYVINYLKKTSDEEGNNVYETREIDLKNAYARQGVELSNKELQDELVANATESFLSDIDFIEDLVKENKSLAKQILDVLKQMLEDLKNVFAEKYDAKSKEGKALQDDLEAREEALKLWTNAIKNQNKEAVKKNDTRYSMKEDSEGRELSPQQQEYFKDSKVVDEDGNLLVVYHGSLNDFTEFRRNVNYYSDNKEVGETYTSNGNLYEGYLNITNPIVIEANGEKWSMIDISNIKIDDVPNIKKFLDYYGASTWKEKGATRTSTADLVAAISDAIDEEELSADGIIIKNIYDEGSYAIESGKLLGNDYITFNSNQFKNVDNKAPTENPDIRFSLKEPVEETKDLIAVHNVNEQQLIETLKLGGFAMPSIAIIKAPMGHTNFGKISVVFIKNAIDPKASKDNKVYSGDAYTPTFPHVGYKINSEKLWDIEDKIKSLMGKEDYNDFGHTDLYPDNVERNIENNSGNIVDAFYNTLLLKYAYTKDKNIDIDTPYDIKDYDVFHEFSNDVVESVARQIEKNNNLYKLLEIEDSLNSYEYDKNNGIIQNYVDYLNDYYKKEFGEDIGDLYDVDNFGYSKWHQLIKALNKYASRKVEKIINKNELSKKVDEYINEHSDDYKKWLNDLFNGVIEKKGIRNNRDLFTPSGDSRSFEQLYDEYNLNNIVKKMKSEPDVGKAMGGFSLFGSSNDEYKSISEIKANRDRLQNIDEVEYSKLKDDIENDLFEIAKRIKPSAEWDTYETKNDIAEAVATKKTKSGIKSFLSQWYKISDKDLDDIMKLVDRAKSLPVGYFESKPKRAVGFDEVAYAIIPNNSSQELIDLLKKNNIDYVEYKAGDNEDRKEKLNSRPDIRFSMKEDYGKGGYNGKSMSNRATKAYEYGEKPLSKWTKSVLLDEIDDILFNNDSGVTVDDFKKLTVKELKDNFLDYSSWHHTGALYNTTDFFKLNEDRILNTTKDDINKIIDNRKNRKAEEEELKRRKEEQDKIINDYYISRRPTIEHNYIELPKHEYLRQKGFELTPFTTKSGKKAYKYIENGVEKTVMDSAKYSVNLNDEPDIRFSLKEESNITRNDVAALTGKDPYMAEAVKDLEDIMRMKGGEAFFRANQKELYKIYDEIAEEYNIKDYSKKRFADNIKELFDYIQSVDNPDGVDTTMLAMQIADDMLDKGSIKDTSMEELYPTLQQQLRDYKIKIADQDKADLDGGYNAFRKKYFGSLTLSNDGTEVDSVYEDLASSYPELFPEDITHPADRLTRIADVADMFRKTVDHIEGATRNESAFIIAQDIINKAVLEQTKNDKSIDNKKRLKAQEKVRKQNTNLKKAKKDIHDDYVKLQNKVKALESINERLDRKLTKAENELGRQKKEFADWAMGKKQVNKEDKYYKRKYDKLMQEFSKKKVAEMQKKYSAERRKNIEKIRKMVNELDRSVRRPDKNHYIPKYLVNSMLDVLRTIDLDSGYRKPDGSETLVYMKLKEMQKQYQEMKNDMDYAIASEYNETIDKSIGRLAEITKGRRLNELLDKDIADIVEIMEIITYQMRTARDLLENEKLSDIKEASQKAREQIKEAGRTFNTDAKLKNLFNRYLNNSLSPVRVMRRLEGYAHDGVLSSLGEELQQGERKTKLIRQTAYAMLDELYKDTKAIKALEKFRSEKLTYNIGGKNIVITPDMRAAIYLHSLNEQNMKHVVGNKTKEGSYRGGGIIIPNYQKQMKFNNKDSVKVNAAEKYTGQDAVRLSPSDVDRIIKDMTEYDKRIVELYQQVNEYLTKELNDTTMNLYGFKKATVKNYFPLIVDKSILNLDSDALKFDKTLESFGFLKERVNSAKPIYLEGVMDALERQIDQSSLFSGMAIPSRDFKKVWNYAAMDENDKFDNVNKQAQKAMGSYIDKYVGNLQADLAQARERGDNLALLSAFSRGKMAMSALTGNLSVVLKQAASYPTAAGGVLGYQDLLAGLTPKGQRGKTLEKTMNKYTPLYQDRNTATITGVNINDMNLLKRRNPKLYYALTGWIESMDKATVRRLWYASENYVKRNFDYKVGSDNYYEEVAKVWEDTIRRTQPIYDTMSRPEFLRTTSDIGKFLMMFKTQALQNVGIMVENYGELKARKRDYEKDKSDYNLKELENAQWQFRKAVSSQIIQSIIFTGITALVDAFIKHRPDKWADEETGLITPESLWDNFIKAWTDNVIGQLAFGDIIRDLGYYPVKTLITGKEQKRFDLSIPPVDAINDIITSTNKIANAVANRDLKKAIYYGKQLGTTAAQYGFGLPVKNIENLYKGLEGNIRDIASGKNPLEQSTDKQMYNRIYLAYQSGNPELAKELSEGYDEDKIKTKMVSKLKEEDTIKEAADYRYNSELDKYQAIVDAYVSLGFDEDWVVSAINSVMNKTYDTTGSGEYNSNDLQRAIDISAVKGSKVAQELYDEKYATYKADGLKNDEAKKKALSSVKSAITGKYKSQYESGTTSQKVKIRDRLCSLRVAGERLYTYDSMKSWNK